VTPVPIRVTQAPTRPELPDKPDKAEKPDKPEPGIRVSSTLVKAQDTDPSTKGKVDPRDGTFEDAHTPLRRGGGRHLLRL